MTTIEKLRIICQDNFISKMDLFEMIEMAVELDDVVTAIDDFYKANYDS